jgi:predicted Zn finger-like uncharacterized protein
MSIRFRCPHCSAAIRVDDHLAGKKGKCPTCARAIGVPTENIFDDPSGMRSTLPVTTDYQAEPPPVRLPAAAPDPFDFSEPDEVLPADPGPVKRRPDRSVAVGLLIASVITLPIVAGCAGVFWMLRLWESKPPAAPVERAAHDDLTRLINRYGAPDEDESTAYDRPRPPIVTRIVTYRKERVRAVFVPDGEARMNTPPPYSHWKLVGFTDPVAEKALSAGEASSRLAARSK